MITWQIFRFLLEPTTCKPVLGSFASHHSSPLWPLCCSKNKHVPCFFFHSQYSLFIFCFEPSSNFCSTFSALFNFPSFSLAPSFLISITNGPSLLPTKILHGESFAVHILSPSALFGLYLKYSNTLKLKQNSGYTIFNV